MLYGALDRFGSVKALDRFFPGSVASKFPEGGGLMGKHCVSVDVGCAWTPNETVLHGKIDLQVILGPGSFNSWVGATCGNLKYRTATTPHETATRWAFTFG
jgi:hypothetical protein